jgi:hypothetical protein
LIVLVRGNSGFHYMAGDQTPEIYNGALGLTYEQVEAMEYGAMFGFEAELADPDVVRKVREEMGLPVGVIKTAQAKQEAPAVVKRPAARVSDSIGAPTDMGNFVPWVQESLARTQSA